MRLAVQGDVIGIDLGQLRGGGEVGYGYSPPTLEDGFPPRTDTSDTWLGPGSTDIRNICLGGFRESRVLNLYMTLASWVRG